MPQLILNAKEKFLLYSTAILLVILNVGLTVGTQWLAAFEDVEPGDLTPHKILVKWVFVGTQVALTLIALVTKLEKKVASGKSLFDDDTNLLQRPTQ